MLADTPCQTDKPVANNVNILRVDSVGSDEKLNHSGHERSNGLRIAKSLRIGCQISRGCREAKNGSKCRIYLTFHKKSEKKNWIRPARVIPQSKRMTLESSACKNTVAISVQPQASAESR